MDRLWNFSSIVLGRHLRIVFVGQLQLFQQWLGQAIIRPHLLLFLSWWKDAHKFKEKISPPDNYPLSAVAITAFTIEGTCLQFVSISQGGGCRPATSKNGTKATPNSKGSPIWASTSQPVIPPGQKQV